ncbi:AAA family ATPase [Candidatus Lokiarchaeum ossiferum]|uniref:AAA family ATPase n=1 Tax=Candidatus Lokiarchaeum ossiferum TaxID=2951803 RepID=UPI00352D8C92
MDYIPNEEMIFSQKKDKFPYISINDFVTSLLLSPELTMLWGDVGTGKTTIALQLILQILEKTDQKCFYLHTKQSPIKQLIKRIIPQWDKFKSQVLFWQVNTFKEQLDVIIKWQLQIEQLERFFKHPRVGFIVIDEIASQYLLELGTDKKNEHINQEMTLILATLTKICREKEIPILLLNNFTKRKQEDETLVAMPYGGKIISYWTDNEIKIERTSQVSRMKFTLTKKSHLSVLPSSWTYSQGEKGFF